MKEPKSSRGTSTSYWCVFKSYYLAPFSTGAAVGRGTKRGVTTEVVTESRIETGIGREKILTVGKAQERREDTENAPGVETGTRTGQGHGTENDTETDTANLSREMSKVSLVRIVSLKYKT